MPTARTLALALALGVAPLAFGACHHGPTECTDPTTPGCMVASDKERITSPAVSAADLDAAVAGNTAFGLDLYQSLRAQDGNLFFSPFSISGALAMTWAGAGGETAAQMAKALHFSLGSPKQHAAFDKLDLALASRGQDAEGQDGEPFALDVANALWGQIGSSFQTPFLDTAAQYYGAGMHIVDFVKDPEGSRGIINEWVSARTDEKIPELLAPGSIDASTRLVLTNAVYFNARWASPFEAGATKSAAFTRADGSVVEVPTMAGSIEGGYGEGEGYKAAWLDYDGKELSMVFLLPTAGTLDAFEASLTADRLAAIAGGTTSAQLDITLPRFKIESSFSLAEQLAALGMKDAFSPDLADFSGIDGKKDLHVAYVVHKAYVNVDESGTEAAAATGVGVTLSAMPETQQIRLDRPFLFFIRDNATKTVIFFGRVADPS